MKQSPIFVKTYDLLVWLLGRTGNFPKNERFRMARRLEDSAFAFHDLLLQAGRLSKERREEKRRLLLRADVELSATVSHGRPVGSRLNRFRSTRW